MLYFPLNPEAIKVANFVILPDWHVVAFPKHWRGKAATPLSS